MFIVSNESDCKSQVRIYVIVLVAATVHTKHSCSVVWN